MSLLVPILLTILYLALLGIAAVFSGLDTALFALRERMGDESELNAKARHEIKQDPMGLLPEVLLLGCLANLLLATVGLYLVMEPLHLAGWPWFSSALIIFGSGLLFVEIIPNFWAMRAPVKMIHFTLPLFLKLRVVVLPLSKKLQGLSEKLVAFLTPKRLKPRQMLLIEELATMIEMSREQGAITTDESTLLYAMIDLQGLTARDVMTPRLDLPLMPHDAKDDEVAQMLEGARHRFVVVFDEKTDAIAYMLDVERWKLLGRPHWSTVTTAPVFVPETLPLMNVWKDNLQTDGVPVIAVDEYGGFEGLLSRANIVDRVLTKTAPTQSTPGAIQSIGPNRYLVSGGTRLKEIEQELEVTLKAEGIDTIGGLAMNHFGYPPKPGEHFTTDDLSIKVKRTSRARILQLELRVLKTEEDDA
ncbi:hemolysin family protein [soil metagenome]